MNPLFPRLHINDADKGGPRTPPRNKMALCQQYNLSSHTSKMPLPPIKDCSSFVSQAPSNNVGSAKQKVLPPCNSIPRSSQLTDEYRSLSPIGAISNSSMATAEGLLSGTQHCGNQHASMNLVTKADCNLLRASSFSSSNKPCQPKEGDEMNDVILPAFLGKGIVNYGNTWLCSDKEKAAAFSSISAGVLHNVCLQLPTETRIGDHTSVHLPNLVDKYRKLSFNYESCSQNIPFTSSSGHKVSSDAHHGCRVLHKSKTVADGMSLMHETLRRKRLACATEDPSRSSPRLGENNLLTKISLINSCSNDEDSGAFLTGNADKTKDVSENSAELSIPGLTLTPEDVTRVIGKRLFWKARKTIFHQQKIFSLQIFELHRLIKVQKLIKGLPEMTQDDNFHALKPSIQFPPMAKLLHVTPLDTSPAVSNPKVESKIYNLAKDCETLPESQSSAIPTIYPDKVHRAKHLTPKLSPALLPIPVDTKLAPWYLNALPPGNQWLVQVRSPSEGLIYKPYSGPCFPTLGLTAPVYGNYGHISHGVPASDEFGIGRFYGTTVSPSYFQTYPLPLITANDSNLQVQQMNTAGAAQMDLGKSSLVGNALFGVPCQIPCTVSRQQSAVVSDCDRNSHKTTKESENASSPAEHHEGPAALCLFPTTPSAWSSKDDSDDHKVKVIKVVPHNRTSAPESAARIFQFIQEERTNNSRHLS